MCCLPFEDTPLQQTLEKQVRACVPSVLDRDVGEMLQAEGVRQKNKATILVQYGQIDISQDIQQCMCLIRYNLGSWDDLRVHFVKTASVLGHCPWIALCAITPLHNSESLSTHQKVVKEQPSLFATAWFCRLLISMAAAWGSEFQSRRPH